MESLNFSKRDCGANSKAKKLRKKGLVPGIIYGKNLNSLMFEVGELDICREISKIGQHGILDVEFDGNRKKALIKDVQRDPLTNKIIHLDLQELEKNERIISSVPIVYSGEEYLHKKGMVLQKEKDSIKVEGYYDEIPKNIKIDMKEVNKGFVYRVADLEIASEISIIEDLNSVVASVGYEQLRKEEVVEDNIEESDSE